MSIGRDHGSPVSRRYVDDFVFEGRIERVDIQLVSQGSADEKERRAAREGRPVNRGEPCNEYELATSDLRICPTSPLRRTTPRSLIRWR